MIPALTPSQIRMFQLLADGHTYYDIAARLYLAQSTVNTTIRNARIRLGAATTADALTLATTLGLITATTARENQ